MHQRVFRRDTVLALLVLLMVVTSSSALAMNRRPRSEGLVTTKTIYRVNAGGPALSGVQSWSADTKASPSPYVNATATGNKTYTTDASVALHQSVPAGTPPEVFRSGRWDQTQKWSPAELQWRFPVTAGEYEVRLYFAETAQGRQYVGARRFNVYVEGTRVLDNYDIFADVGGYKGVMKSFVTTSDADIDIAFGHAGSENPIVSGIEIVAASGGVAPAPSPSPTPSPSSTPAPSPSPSPSPTPTPAPASTNCTGVQLNPSTHPTNAAIQQALDANPTGTTFCFAAGTYRFSGSIAPKSGQRLIGPAGTSSSTAPGRGLSAFFNGSRRINQAANVTREGSYSVITGQSTAGASSFGGYSGSQCRTTMDGRDPKGMCVYRDQVFIDDVSLWQVGGLSALSPGKFYWNYSTNLIYLADDPSGHELEVSIPGTTRAVSSIGTNVVLKNLVVEKFSGSVQGGVVSANTGWLIEDCEIRLNHGGGVHVTTDVKVRRSYVHHNGQIGFHGGGAGAGSPGTNILIEANEIAFNNAAGYNFGWEGGGTKFVHTRNLVVRGNYAHGNNGAGLWTDIDNIYTLYENNRVESNQSTGIVHEISFDAVIRNNVVRGNGRNQGFNDTVYNAGIFIDQSPNVEVYGNLVENNNAGITAIQEPEGSSASGYGVREVSGLYVHDNVVRQPSGRAAGLAVYNTTDTSYFTTKNNRYENNVYYLTDPNAADSFRWKSGYINSGEWKGFGHDDTGTFYRL